MDVADNGEEQYEAKSEKSKTLANESEQKELGEIEKKELRRQVAFGNTFQGDIGEGIAERVCSEKLGLTPDPRFDKSLKGHGIDTVYREGKGQLVVVEAKFDERGIKALRGDQMQPAWIERNANLMRLPENERYTQGNAEIGREILDMGVEKVRRLVVCSDPTTLDVEVYEGQADQTWKTIGKWNAYNLEQPYLK